MSDPFKIFNHVFKIHFYSKVVSHVQEGNTEAVRYPHNLVRKTQSQSLSGKAYY